MEREIKFDSGDHTASTVIGAYGGTSYHERVDFSLVADENIRNAQVSLHVHVGSQIKPKSGETESKLAVRINGGPWHWKSLIPYQDDKTQWIDIPVPANELKPGLNRVETTSTITNPNNMSAQSLDIIASDRIGMRSSYSNDLVHYKSSPDRNWGIRLCYEYDSPAENRDIASVTIVPKDSTAYVSEPMQFAVEARDSTGHKFTVQPDKWSCTRGCIDEYGMILPLVNAPTTITAQVGNKTATAVCDVKLRTPAGVADTQSNLRLKPGTPKDQIDMNGSWHFRLDTNDEGEKLEWFKNIASEWGNIQVPGSWQAQGWGIDYHGVAWYQKEIDIPTDKSGEQVWIRYDGVATNAKVWVNGQLVGEHTNNWSPFDLRITDAIKPSKTNVITVRVKEDRGHVSAGFPKNAGMHYGGIWQPVRIYSTGAVRIEDAFVFPHLAAKIIDLEVTPTGKSSQCKLIYSITGPDGAPIASANQALDTTTSEPIKITIPIKNPAAWSPDSPQLYTAKVELWQDGKLSDHQTLRFGMRDVEANAHQILLNGKPIYICGVLHWGYYPNLVSIMPSDAQIRKEFIDLKAAGFNLVKICLFMMPKRFYDIADETGMLIWQEYPTWETFPQKGSTVNEGLVQEYKEWFSFDRNHASVIIRDLTCESPNPDPTFMESLYKLSKSMTRGGVIEDNSSVLNQVFTDFYDCHYYRELDTMYSDLGGLIPWLNSKTPVKPYLTGEDFDCDTFRDTAAIRAKLVRGDQLPWWLDTSSFHQQETVEQQLTALYGPKIVPEMAKRQLVRAGIVRKAMLEEFRRFPELAGYVMTHLTDITLTSPGFYDDLGNPKWTRKHWSRFTGDRVLALYSPRRSRSYKMDEIAELEVLLSNFADPLASIPIKWKLTQGKTQLASGNAVISAARGEVTKALELKLSDLKFDNPSTPTQCTLSVETGDIANEWTLWFFPTKTADPTADAVITTNHLDADTIKRLREGARVIYLATDEDQIIPRRNAPFWREMSIWLPTGHPSLGDFPHNDIVDLQFMDMTQRKPFDTSLFRPEITPLIWGINNRFGDTTFADYIFEVGVGKGKLLACCLKLQGPDNIAGQYLQHCLTQYAASDTFNPKPCPEAGELSKILK